MVQCFMVGVEGRGLKRFFEKVDWIMSDEIEDAAVEDMTAENLVAEEEIVISTVAVREGNNASVCPVIVIAHTVETHMWSRLLLA